MKNCDRGHGDRVEIMICNLNILRRSKDGLMRSETKLRVDFSAVVFLVVRPRSHSAFSRRNSDTCLSIPSRFTISTLKTLQHPPTHTQNSKLAQRYPDHPAHTKVKHHIHRQNAFVKHFQATRLPRHNNTTGKARLSRMM